VSKKIYRNFLVILALVFVIKAIAPFYGSFHGAISTGSKEVDALYADLNIICSTKSPTGEAIIADSKLPNKNHSNCFECPYCSSNTASGNYVISKLPVLVYLKPSYNYEVILSSSVKLSRFLKSTFSQAPPLFV
jgi:hypothetical protein